VSAATGTFVKPNQHRLYEELKQFPRTPGIGTLPDNRAGAVSQSNHLASTTNTSNPPVATNATRLSFSLTTSF
jgi:hypothetical protein